MHKEEEAGKRVVVVTDPFLTVESNKESLINMIPWSNPHSGLQEIKKWN